MGGSIHILWAGQAPDAHAGALGALGEVSTASSLIDAMRIANEVELDAAVIDPQLLSDGAFTLLRHLRSRSSRRYLPVIFWGASATAELRVQALVAGGDDFVDATVSPDELVARLTRALSVRVRI